MCGGVYFVMCAVSRMAEEETGLAAMDSRRAMRALLEAELNDRQLGFCRNLASGMSQLDAYREAGYKAKGKAAITNASRLASDPRVTCYVLMLREEMSEQVIAQNVVPIIEGRLMLAQIIREQPDPSMKMRAFMADCKVQKDFDGVDDTRTVDEQSRTWEKLTEEEKMEQLGLLGSRAFAECEVEV